MNTPVHRPSETSPPLAIGIDGFAQSTCCRGQLQKLGTIFLPRENPYRKLDLERLFSCANAPWMPKVASAVKDQIPNMRVAIIFFLFTLSPLINAVTYVVNSTADNTTPFDGQLTLREAVMAASTDSQVGDAPPGEVSDEIRFSQALEGKTILLQKGALEITRELKIISPPQRPITLDAGTLSRVLYVSDGKAQTKVKVALSGLVITQGSTGSSGGGIYNEEDLQIENCIFANNRAGGLFTTGGGIYSRDGKIQITNCSFFSNNDRALASRGEAIISNSKFIGNSGGLASVSVRGVKKNKTLDHQRGVGTA